MPRQKVIKVCRSKKIGKFYTIKATPLGDKCIIELTKFISQSVGFKHLKLGTFQNSTMNQKAYRVYFGIKTVKHCNEHWNASINPKILLR
jgi:hypothetical protein